MPGYKSRKRQVSSDDDEVVKPAKKTKTKDKAAGDEGRDDDGNAFWQLAPMRRLTISEFKGQTLVNIREYWTDKSGEMKPGKKGISLTVEQYSAVIEALPAINAELESKGVKVPNLPSSGHKPAATAVAADDDDDDDSDAPVSPVKSKSKAKPKSKEKEKNQKKKKMNIEATSDEEEAEEDDVDEDED
ncbi:ssDNA-binding transcriptional regulator [Xylariaceae sp. FL1019]|nr:ssDNA-binding transcriptional regulator [Xylariaceae sp. FL1019]